MVADEILGRSLRTHKEAVRHREAAEAEFNRLRRKLIAAGEDAASETFRVEDLAIYGEVLNVDALKGAAEELRLAKVEEATAKRHLDEASR